MVDVKGWAEKAVELAAAGKTMELQGHVIAVQKELIEARNEIVELKEQLEAKETVRHENGIVYFGDNTQPFCGTCYGRDRKHHVPLVDSGDSLLRCAVCKAHPPKPGVLERAAAAPRVVRIPREPEWKTRIF